MDILKNVWLDLIVTAVIAVAVFTGQEVAYWAVVVYTPFMVLLKIIAFSGRHKPSRFKPQDAGVPLAVYHVLYAANFGLLVFGSLRVSDSWWWMAGCWGVIWLLSALSGKGKAVSK
jgi:hypothetical protein